MKQTDMKHRDMKQENIGGFTLIEIMVVVAIIGIISSFAYSSYQDSVRKTKRAEAKTTLMELAQRMERCYTANGNYDTNCSVLNGADLATVLSEHEHYDLAVADLSPTTFAFTATATFADPMCDVFTITNTGAKSAVDDGGTDSTTTCW